MGEIVVHAAIIKGKQTVGGSEYYFAKGVALAGGRRVGSDVPIISKKKLVVGQQYIATDEFKMPSETVPRAWGKRFWVVTREAKASDYKR